MPRENVQGMGEDARPTHKATPRTRSSKARLEQSKQPKASLDASPQTYSSSIPRVPSILSPEEVAARRNQGRTNLPGPIPGRIQGRTREQSAARPLAQLPGTLKLPAIPREAHPDSNTKNMASSINRMNPSYPEPESRYWRDWDDDGDPEDGWDQYAKNTRGGELLPVPGINSEPGYPVVTLSPDSVPDLAVFQTLLRAGKPRRRVNTQMLVERARSPWSIARLILAVLVMVAALFATVNVMGEPSQQLMQAAFVSSAGSLSAPSVAERVQPETQLLDEQLYDNPAQFEAWGDADCSAATASEVLTAWGVPGATIGKLIDTMQPDISLDGGLLTITGYQRGVSPFGYQADISDHLTYNQIVYISHTLGLPVIVNVRISYGYFHFFSGGHFLVMTNGDSQGLTIVDSSEYYIKYLPRDVFYSMFTGITVVIVPKGYSYSIP
ncbi:MAG: hypothetical protein ACLQUY_03020, partial [Ktedonobacterales bacterium]